MRSGGWGVHHCIALAEFCFVADVARPMAAHRDQSDARVASEAHASFCSGKSTALAASLKPSSAQAETRLSPWTAGSSCGVSSVPIQWKPKPMSAEGQ